MLASEFSVPEGVRLTAVKPEGHAEEVLEVLPGQA